MSLLTERLGLGPTARAVIITADGLGLSQASNDGVYDAIRSGRASSASIMVPAPWSRGAAGSYRGESVGVDLTLLSPFDAYRWGPTTRAPSLLDGDGGFPRTLDDLWNHADLDEVRRECLAQIERAVLWGFDVTHLVSYRDALVMRPEFLDVLLDVAIDYRLPVRLASAERQRTAGFSFLDHAAEEGIVTPDQVVHVRGTTRLDIEYVLADLPDGVTELVFRPCRDTPEIRGFDDRWPVAVDDHRILTGDSRFPIVLERSGVAVVGWDQLRALARAS